MSGNAQQAGYSSAGHEPLSTPNPQLSEPQGEMTGNSGGAPYNVAGHGGPVSTTVHEAESYRQSQIAAREPIQHDPVGNAIATGAVIGVFGMAQAMGQAATGGVAQTVLAGEAGVAGKAAFAGGKEAAKDAVKEGVEYTFKHMDDPSLHKGDSPDGGAPRAEQHVDPNLPHDSGSSQDPLMSQDPGMSYDPGMSQDPGMSHDDPGYVHH
jgi:hypothetical protein